MHLVGSTPVRFCQFVSTLSLEGMSRFHLFSYKSYSMGSVLEHELADSVCHVLTRQIALGVFGVTRSGIFAAVLSLLVRTCDPH
jgi:hypothetical protein